MKRLGRILFVVAVACGVAGSAHVAVAGPTGPFPAMMQVAPGSELSLLLFVSGSLADSDTATLSGSGELSILQDFELDTFGFAPVGVQVNSLSIGLTNLELKIDLGPFGGGADLATFGVTVGGMGPMVVAVPNGPGMAIADLAGTTLALDGGVLTYLGSGAIGSALGTGTFDFEAEPLDVVLPAGSTVKITEEQVGPNKYNVTVFIPIDVAQSVVSTPVLVEAGLVGEIILTGMKIVPEPGTLVLLGVGAIGFVAAVARRRRRR